MTFEPKIGDTIYVRKPIRFTVVAINS